MPKPARCPHYSKSSSPVQKFCPTCSTLHWNLVISAIFFGDVTPAPLPSMPCFLSYYLTITAQASTPSLILWYSVSGIAMGESAVVFDSHHPWSLQSKPVITIAVVKAKAMGYHWLWLYGECEIQFKKRHKRLIGPTWVQNLKSLHLCILRGN